MKKELLSIFFCFAVIGIISGSLMVAADEGSNSESSSDSSSDSATSANSGSNSGSSDDESEVSDSSGNSDDKEDELNEDSDAESETEDKEDNENDENKTKVKSRELIREGNCVVKIEKETRIEDGKRIEVIKKKMKCADGTEAEFKVKVDNRTEDGKYKEKFKYEFKNKELEVEAEDEIGLEEDTNGTEYKLKARLRNGNVTQIKIMPDTASEIAIERLKALNFTIQLREKIHNNIPKVVYNIEANKNGKFLGVFKLKMKSSAQIDPETGEVLEVNTPWWAFFVTGEDETPAEDKGNETSVNETASNEQPVLGNESVNETIAVENNSSP